MSQTTSHITVEPSEIGTGAVFPEQYEEQLANKLARVQELFSGLKLPPVEATGRNLLTFAAEQSSGEPAAH